MSYQQKYLKYKNKYLGLKSKYGHLLNVSNTETSLPETTVPNNKLFNDLSTDTPTSMPLNVKIINSMNGGGNMGEETETETTIRNTDNTEEVRKLFKQIAGAKAKKSKSKSKNVAKKHFLHDDSDLFDSTDTSSLARDDSEFSSSEIDW
jgi:hypothetical protein